MSAAERAIPTTSMTFENPVLPGFHPDPTVCRVDENYFLAASSFTYFPGVPLFHSRNLVDWSQIGNVLDRPSQLDLSASRNWSSLGICAPTLRHHGGRFWLITTNVVGLGTFLVTSDDPAGPWSDPVPVPVPGIDPDLAWDCDGNCWVHFSDVGRGIARAKIDPLTGAILDGPEPTWSGSGLQFPEAPHLYERDGIWYLLIAEGGTERGHCVSVARGSSPKGPWEASPSNPILSHRSTSLPIQNTGHADLTQATDGSWWMVLLGTRPRGITPGFHVLGRETFLTPVDWVDGWPVPGTLGLRMDHRPPGTSQLAVNPVRDDFDSATLAPLWVAVRRPPSAIGSLLARPGWLILSGSEATLDSPEPVLIGRRQQHHRCRVRSLVDIGSAEEAGLVLYLDESAHYEVAVTRTEVHVRCRSGPLRSVLARTPRPDGALVLCLSTKAHALGPDVVVLGFESHDGATHTLAELDGRYLSTEVTGGFLGRVVAMYAVGGQAAFDWFDYEPMPEEDQFTSLPSGP